MPEITCGDLIKLINEMPITHVLKCARILDCDDYAIRHYYLKRSKLYKNEERARKAVRRKIYDLYRRSWYDYREVNMIEYLMAIGRIPDPEQDDD